VPHLLLTASPLLPSPLPLPADWRARVFLWPDSTACEPMCIKLRGKDDAVSDYGRTVTCN
jgi:hypothetical protein